MAAGAAVLETFGGPDGLDLGAHLGEHGGYERVAGTTSLLLHSGRLIPSTGRPVFAHLGYVPPSPDLTLWGLLVVLTATNAVVSRMGVGIRQSAGESYYKFSWSSASGLWELDRWNNGSFATLSTYAQALQVGAVRLFGIRAVGSLLTGLVEVPGGVVGVDGVEAGPGGVPVRAVVTATDTTHTAAGRIVVAARGTGSPTTGQHLDTVWVDPLGDSPSGPILVGAIHGGSFGRAVLGGARGGAGPIHVVTTGVAQLVGSRGGVGELHGAASTGAGVLVGQRGGLGALLTHAGGSTLLPGVRRALGALHATSSGAGQVAGARVGGGSLYAVASATGVLRGAGDAPADPETWPAPVGTYWIPAPVVSYTVPAPTTTYYVPAP